MDERLNQKRAIRLLEENGWKRSRGEAPSENGQERGETDNPPYASRRRLLARLIRGDPKAGRAKMIRGNRLTLEITANIHLEDGSYWADVPALPGCFASGETLDELVASLEEGIDLYLSDHQEGTRAAAFSLKAAVLSDSAAA